MRKRKDVNPLVKSAEALNRAALDFSKRKQRSVNSLKDGSAPGLQRAALRYARAVRLMDMWLKTVPCPKEKQLAPPTPPPRLQQSENKF